MIQDTAYNLEVRLQRIDKEMMHPIVENTYTSVIHKCSPGLYYVHFVIRFPMLFHMRQGPSVWQG